MWVVEVARSTSSGVMSTPSASPSKPSSEMGLSARKALNFETNFVPATNVSRACSGPSLLGWLRACPKVCVWCLRFCHFCDLPRAGSEARSTTTDPSLD